ncbi:hypothetical protein M0802_010438 [Mischocyttarus mexicanus]|nr:hypothetical protein M0802_010438 [Mischocyttarus mexicanus]
MEIVDLEIRTPYSFTMLIVFNTGDTAENVKEENRESGEEQEVEKVEEVEEEEAFSYDADHVLHCHSATGTYLDSRNGGHVTIFGNFLDGSINVFVPYLLIAIVNIDSNRTVVVVLVNLYVHLLVNESIIYLLVAVVKIDDNRTVVVVVVVILVPLRQDNLIFLAFLEKKFDIEIVGLVIQIICY